MFRYARFLSAYALVAALASGGVAHAEVQALEVIQPGDADLTCEAMATQINTLTAAQAKAAKRAASGRKLLGFATTALQVAGPMLSSGKTGGDGGMGAMMAQQAMGQMQAQAMQQQMGGMAAMGGMGGFGAEPAPSTESLETQRLARLNHLHVQKGC